MRITPTDNRLTPLEIIYCRPFKVPVFCIDDRKAEEKKTVADWMIKMLRSQEVMSKNNLQDDYSRTGKMHEARRLGPHWEGPY